MAETPKKQSPAGNGEIKKKAFNLHLSSKGTGRGNEQNTGRAGTNEPRNYTKKYKCNTKPLYVAHSVYDGQLFAFVCS